MALATALAAYALGALFLLTASGVRLTQDDGFYYFKIAQSLAAGQGSTFDGLHPTNGYHPLWLLVLAGLFRLQPDPGRALAAGTLLQAVLTALTVSTLYLAARRTLGRLGSVAAALLWFGLTYSVSLSGVEFALHALLLAAAAHVYVGARLQGSLSPRGAVVLGLLLALLSLARLDAAMLAALMGAPLVLPGRRRASLWIVVLPALTLAAYAIVNLSAFGIPFPISGAVKRSWSSYLLVHDPVYVRAGWLGAKAWQLTWPWRHPGGWPMRALLGGGLGAALLLALPSFPRPRLLAWWKERVLRPWSPLVIYGAVQYCAYLLVYHEHYSFTRWYYAVQPMVAALLVGATADWLVAPRARRAALVRPLAIALCLLVALATLRGVVRLRRQQAGVREGPLHRAAGWVRTHLPQTARIGTWNAGIIGYLSQRQVVNLDGLVNTRRYLEREQYDLCAYWDANAIGYVVDVFQPGSSVIDGTTLPVASFYARCAGRLELLWQDGAAGDPGWPKAFRLRPSAPAEAAR